MSHHILVVEDRDSLRRMMRRALEQEGYRVATAADLPAARDMIQQQSYDLVLTDLKLPTGSGLDVVAAVREAQAATPTVVITGFGTVSDAVEAMKRGAVDFLEKPLDIDRLYELVRGLLVGDASAQGFEVAGAPPIVGRHPALRAALRLVRKVAPTDSTVLITGESGTGKELAARAIHALSPRAKAPFVAVNCAALPESLAENELFGHEKGAYTGADRRAAGRFEQAAGGTLFLDEIGELALTVQGKVLRVIEERVFDRVGGGTVAADVRLLAATNRDLEAMTRDSSFRADLYYRLEVFPIELPPLRARAEDIPTLARHLVARIAGRIGCTEAILTPAAESLLAQQSWPGNIRQLANVLERALILGDRPRIDARDLAPLLQAATADDERTSVRRALEATDGDKHAAARRLGISYRTLQRKVREHDLEGVPRYR